MRSGLQLCGGTGSRDEDEADTARTQWKQEEASELVWQTGAVNIPAKTSQATLDLLAEMCRANNRR